MIICRRSFCCHRRRSSWTTCTTWITGPALSACRGAEVLAVQEMERNEEVWADWLAQENEYAVGDRKSMEAGGGKYLNFIAIVLRKK